ncbi:leucine-rich repeat neuronal protein 4 [Cottoperca gobio]|uniref:Leucine-rich repeat neuronal protein 4 n=1 Tax=Cottoperca gobio TaxID=56716 RepID=A0A6J2R4J7_COTGO|nr:leucine-rich repeat neuronal protein 4-like [Cottoperca gobio]
MAGYRDLPFPLAIVCLVLIRGYSPLPTTSQVIGTNSMSSTTPSGILSEASDDYSQEEEPTTTVTQSKVSPYGEIPKRCDYNPCVQGQICADLETSTDCLCPGFTSHNVAPDPPILKSATWNGSDVVIQWCAPHSHVTSYIVTVGGEERQTFGKERRSGGVGDMDHIAKVCVVAVNDAGDSEGSCLMYQPRDRNLPLKAGLIGGALAFLLLLLLAVLLWRHRRQRKQEASISMHVTSE